MHFAFTDDQLLFRDTVRDFLANECTPADVRRAWEGDTGRVPGLWAKLAEMGVVGLTAPEHAGGMGMDELDLVLLLEEAGRAVVPEPLLEHTAVAIPALRDYGGPEVAEHLAAAAAGERLVTTALGGSYALYAEQAALVLVADGDDLHLVPREAAGLVPQRSVDHSRRLAAVGWDPGAGTLLAAGAEGAKAIEDACNRGAVAAAAQCVGIASHLIEVTVDYVGQRHQFGRPVGSYQAVKHHLANALLAVEFARPLVYVGAYAMARSTPHRSRDVSVAKAAASEAVDVAIRIALQCHGAIGYTFEYDLHLWMKRGWALAAAWGDAGHHLDRVGRDLGIE